MCRRIFAALSVFLLSFALSSAAQAAKVQLTIGSSPPGFTAIVVAGGFATFVNKEVGGVSISVPTSKGFVQNLRSMERGTFEFMLNATGLVSQAVDGKKPFKKKFKHIRALLPFVAVPYHFVTLANSGVKSVADLKGKRVNIGPKGGITNLTTSIILKTAGIYESVSLEHLSAAGASTALTDNRITAFFQPAPLPAGNVVKTGNVSGGIRLIPITGELAQNALKRLPGRSHMTIPAGLYKGVDKPVKTLGHSAIFAVRDTVSADIVYRVVKAIMTKKGQEYLPKVHKATRNIFKLAPGFDSFKAAKIKLHPGVVRYWKEKGVKIPAELL